MKTVHEIKVLTGVSERTLHYYDELGILKASERDKNNVRLYSDLEVKRLWIIQFLKAAGYKLTDIKELQGNRGDEAYFESISTIVERLKTERDRLDKLLGVAEQIKSSGIMPYPKELCPFEDFITKTEWTINPESEYAKEWMERVKQEDALQVSSRCITTLIELRAKGLKPEDDECQEAAKEYVDYYVNLCKEYAKGVPDDYLMGRSVQNFVSSLGVFSAGGEVTKALDQVGEGTGAFIGKALIAYASKSEELKGGNLDCIVFRDCL